MINWQSKNVSLTRQQADFVQTCVSSGRFQSVSEVVRAGLRLLEDQEVDRQLALDKARRLIQEGAEQADRGQVVDGAEFMTRWEHKHADLQAKTASEE